MDKKSIYKEFYTKLIIATTFFILILSLIFYGFTKSTIYENVVEDLINKAKYIYNISLDFSLSKNNTKILIEDGLNIDLVTMKHLNTILVELSYKDDNHYIELFYPFDLSKHTFIKLSKNIKNEDDMLRTIFSNIFIVSLAGLMMIVVYALTMSKALLNPILNISKKLSLMDESSLCNIDEKKLPIEFLPLAKSINTLTKKIKSYMKYQKELFIGTAHELKTPLTVMKLKSEVTLKKKREIEKYEDVLKLHISEINRMNSMITSILDIGRQEGAQFEKPIEIDIVDFLSKNIKDYIYLTKDKNINLKYCCTIDKFYITIQVTLLNQILQNFIQNAIKFTKKDSIITVASYKIDDMILIEIIDEGDGIDDNIDLFAPFKRVGNSSGAGLGLYLAKNAADTLGAKISLKNRTDGIKGTVATLALATNPTCVLPDL